MHEATIASQLITVNIEGRRCCSCGSDTASGSDVGYCSVSSNPPRKPNLDVASRCDAGIGALRTSCGAGGGDCSHSTLGAYIRCSSVSSSLNGVLIINAPTSPLSKQKPVSFSSLIPKTLSPERGSETTTLHFN